MIAEELGDKEGDDDSQISPALVLKYTAQHVSGISKLHGELIANYAVDALWDCMPELTNWSTYATLLEQENTATEEDELSAVDTTLSSDEETMLCLFLSAAARRACGQLQLMNVRKIQSTSRAVVEAKADVSSFFAGRLSKLFGKFSAEPVKAQALMELTALLSLGDFSGSRGTSQLNGLLKQVKDVVLKNADAKLLETATAALVSFSQEDDVPLHSKAVDCLESLADDLVGRLQRAVAKKIPRDADANADTAGTKEESLASLSTVSYQLLTTLDRLHIIAQQHDISHLGFEDSVVQVLRAGADVNQWILESAIQLLPVLLGWRLYTLKAENDQDVADMVTLRDDILASVDVLLVSGTSVVKRSAYYCMLRLAAMFDPHIAGDVSADLVRTLHCHSIL